MNFPTRPEFGGRPAEQPNLNDLMSEMGVQVIASAAEVADLSSKDPFQHATEKIQLRMRRSRVALTAEGQLVSRTDPGDDTPYARALSGVIPMSFPFSKIIPRPTSVSFPVGGLKSIEGSFMSASAQGGGSILLKDVWKDSLDSPHAKYFGYLLITSIIHLPGEASDGLNDLAGTPKISLTPPTYRG